MRRVFMIALTLGLIAAACGDDDAGTTGDTTAPTTVVATSEATTAAPTTTAAPATTAAPTTTEAAGNPLVEAALELEGTHSGEWNNTTFGSSGPIELTIEVDEVAETASVTLDLGGFVFGGADPDPITFEFDLSIGAPDVDVYEFDIPDDGLFGGGTMTFEGADFQFVAPSVPGVGGLEMVVDGQFTETGIEATYTITGLADGTIEIAAGG